MHVQALWRYPVKSMLGERVERAAVTARGLAGDRIFALRDAETGLIVSAKNPRRWPAMFSLSASLVPQAFGADVAALIRLPNGRMVRTDDPGSPDEIGRVLGREVTVVESPPQDAMAEFYNPQIEGVPSEYPDAVGRFRIAQRSPEGTFFDSSPIHIITTASLRAFDAVLEQNGNEAGSVEAMLDARRFRPNVVVDTGDDNEGGFVENDWVGRTLRIGSLRVAVTRATGRCVMVTLPQSDLPRDTAVLRAVVTNSLVKDPGARAEPCAGVYATLRDGDGRIAEGDDVVLE